MENRILDPIDRNSEILFGLFMVLSFTGTLSVATAGQKEVREMLIAALGCNLAWGFVDAVMYVLRNLVTRARQARLWREVIAASGEPAHDLIAQELGPLSSALGPSDLERTRQWMVAQSLHRAPATGLTRQDLLGAFSVFLLVFASTFPPVLPFLFFSEVRPAMRVSAVIGIAMMFLCGYGWGRYAGLQPWRAAFVMAALGAGIQLVIIALGG
ncbi:VIT1/CCC1 transporter family protein [Variovorax sp. YR216]|uniref:VIT1/CCC1 transporter family protein n=1 Tax=Variovorax sp. YR216 TaxID=1882828 RepID=UPI000896AA96|nr:VIT1/CCC1 transporter family protein [Variovorax sp. YR216]SEA21617.1 VIT family protein [Variovorax sp. YR216]